MPEKGKGYLIQLPDTLLGSLGIDKEYPAMDKEGAEKVTNVLTQLGFQANCFAINLADTDNDEVWIITPEESEAKIAEWMARNGIEPNSSQSV